MILDFQQGIVSYPIDTGLQSFLSYAGGYVTLRALNGRTDIAFAHGLENYLLSESTTVPNAWGPLPTTTDCWLYWDIDLRTAIRSFGFTTLAPLYTSTRPSSGVDGQHWFDTSARKMYVFQSGNFREVVRVFAAKVNNANFTPLGSGGPRPYAGSQAGLNTLGKPTGRIIVDDAGKPIRRSDGRFFTSESDFFVNGSPVNSIKLEANILTATADEPLAKFQVVKFVDFDHVMLASYDDTGTTAIAMLMEDLDSGETGAICLQGLITNPAWNWTTPGSRVWVSTSGQLTEIDPHVANSLAYPEPRNPIGRVISRTSLFFDQR